MPKITAKAPQASKDEPYPLLKTFKFYGLVFSVDDGEAIADCPFCSKPKFSVNVETGQWRCFVCGKQGGPITFLEELLASFEESTKFTDLEEFAAERGLQYPETLTHWGVCRSNISGNWVVPTWEKDYSGKLRISQLYNYIRDKQKGRMMLIPTPLPHKEKGNRHGLFGVNLLSSKKDEVKLCEGPWDAIRLWEVLKNAKMSEEGVISHTSSNKDNLLQHINVLATPGSTVFQPKWTKLFKGKYVDLLYDNDHPKQLPNGNTSEPAGFMGVKRAAGIIADKCEEMRYLKWGDEGYTPEHPSGFDVRDLLGDNPLIGLTELANRMEPVPEEFVTEAQTNEGVECLNCTTWKELVTSWRRALKWTEGLDHALAAMLACIGSTNSIGDQLWIKVVGPASCGKSTLCEAVSTNKKHVVAKSTIRGFHSGYKIEGGDGEDNSLVVLLDGKTLVTKDGDTLLQSPNVGQILSEARDIYDGVSRTHYRNKMSKSYEGHRMTWLLCGTSSIRAIDNSELGERFLDCVIMEKIDYNLEDEILWRTANKASAQVDIPSDEDTGYHSTDLARAMGLTGGYIDYLKENAAKLLPAIEFPTEAKRKCVQYGKFVAYMRARPSLHQNEAGERELAARLVSQHIRLAKCLAMVINRDSVDEVVLKRAGLMCRDTARGVVLNIVKLLYEIEDCTAEFRTIDVKMNMEQAKLRKLLRFLIDIGVLSFTTRKKKRCYVLEQEIVTLYEQVVLGHD